MFARLAFVVVLPAFFCYQVIVQLGLLVPYVGGYFTAGSIIALPFAALAYLQCPSRLRFSISIIFVTFLVFLIALVWSAFVGAQLGADVRTTNPLFAYAIKFVVLFLIARTIDSENITNQKIFLFTLLGIVLLVIATGYEGRVSALTTENGEFGAFQFDYQALAFVYLVMMLYATPSQTVVVRLAIYLLSVPTLFFIGARSEFIAFFVAIGAIEFTLARSRLIVMCVISGAFSVFIIFAEFSTFFYEFNNFTNYRVLSLLKISEDESAIERSLLIDDAVKTIANNPVLGDFASYEPGQYAHNILSAWVDMGAMGFLILVILTYGPLVTLLRRPTRSTLFSQALASAVIVALLLTFAKNYTYQMIPISIGLYCRHLMLERRTYNTNECHRNRGNLGRSTFPLSSDRGI